MVEARANTLPFVGEVRATVGGVLVAITISTSAGCAFDMAAICASITEGVLSVQDHASAPA